MVEAVCNLLLVKLWVVAEVEQEIERGWRAIGMKALAARNTAVERQSCSTGRGRRLPLQKGIRQLARNLAPGVVLGLLATC